MHRKFTRLILYCYYLNNDNNIHNTRTLYHTYTHYTLSEWKKSFPRRGLRVIGDNRTAAYWRQMQFWVSREWYTHKCNVFSLNCKHWSPRLFCFCVGEKKTLCIYVVDLYHNLLKCWTLLLRNRVFLNSKYLATNTFFFYFFFS